MTARPLEPLDNQDRLGFQEAVANGKCAQVLADIGIVILQEPRQYIQQQSAFFLRAAARSRAAANGHGASYIGGSMDRPYLDRWIDCCEMGADYPSQRAGRPLPDLPVLTVSQLQNSIGYFWRVVCEELPEQHKTGLLCAPAF
jgi:hypothetical protein